MILIKENENVIGLFHNDISDKFLKNTIEKLGLIQSGVQVIDFTSHKGKLKRYEREDNKIIEIDGNNINLKTIISNAEYEGKIIDTDAINALDYYTQDFINKYNENKEAEMQHLNSGSTDDFVPPHQGITENDLVFGQKLIKESVINLDETITGVIVNVEQKIQQEEV